MGFLKRLLGGNEQPKQAQEYVDTQGVYFYVQCDRCGAGVRLRADKQHDLLNEGNGYTWHKTIVDSRCFRPMPTVVTLNAAYEMVAHQIDGGHYITKDEYDTLLAQEAASRSSDQ